MAELILVCGVGGGNISPVGSFVRSVPVLYINCDLVIYYCLIRMPYLPNKRTHCAIPSCTACTCKLTGQKGRANWKVRQECHLPPPVNIWFRFFRTLQLLIGKQFCGPLIFHLESPYQLAANQNKTLPQCTHSIETFIKVEPCAEGFTVSSAESNWKSNVPQLIE